MRYHFPIFLLLPLLLVGCNMQALPTADAEGNIYITATPVLPTPDAEGVILITATPDTADIATINTPLLIATQIPTNTPLPTAIPDPRGLINEADILLRNGYFEEAVWAYQAILLQIADPTLRAEAAFKLGQAALKEGLFQAAVDSLSIIINETPNDSRLAQARFLRGDAYLGLGQWNLAITDFQAYLVLRPNLIDSYVYERIADAQLALSQIEAALSSYHAALDANRSLVPLLILREKVAQIYASIGQVDEAVAHYDTILSVARNAGYRASIELYAAEALARIGRNEEAIIRAQRVFDNYPQTVSAFGAMQILDANAVELDSYRRGLVNFTYGDYPAAINAFNEFTSTHILAAIPANLYLFLGRAYRELGNWEGARVAFQTIIDQYPDDPLFGTALLERGRTYFLEDDIAKALETYTAIADIYGYLGTTAAEALWRVGYLYGTRLNDFESSRQVFTRLANEYPNSEWAISGLQIAASSAVANDQTAVAENLYGRLAAITVGEDRSGAFYWVGRLARQRGDIAASDQAFAEARSAAPDSFYAQRAVDIPLGREPFQPPAVLNFTFNEEAERQQAEGWLRQVFSMTQTGDLYLMSPELENDPRMIRGQELWAVAAYDEAAEEFDSLIDESRENANALLSYQLAHYLRDIGAYLPSIVASADVIIASGVSTLDAPPYIARMRYPAYYIGLIQEQSVRYGLDPLLLLGLIRQESLFDANATSGSDAMGLAQVIPGTAQYIAGKLNRTNFEERDLYRPYVGIAFGAFYLDEQLKLFDGKQAVALAAYNAGPGYTLDWYRLSGGDVDTFVTTITFDETRLYVQRIYSHYSIYRELYGSG
jgi:soluble lytic murein transglycosylase